MPPIALPDAEATAALARTLAPALRPGDIIALDGPLGAGKTTFTRALVAALDGDPALVASPTFTLLNRYDARWPIYHVDAWRLARPDQLAGTGFLELTEDGIGIVEWAERVAALLPDAGLWSLRLAHAAGGREATVTPPPGRGDPTAGRPRP